ncbi:MAG: ZIP family metal transporter [Enterobacteriaceae bacterium]
MELWVWAGIWGGVAGGALLQGSLVGYYLPLSERLVAAIMAFGSGVLIAALSFELMNEAYEKGGFAATGFGFVAGAIIYTGANYLVSRYGAKHRKRSGDHQATEMQNGGGSGTAIAIGALIDGIPESIVIGLGMIEGGVVSVVAVAAIFISNIPEGLSSTVGMKKAGRSRQSIFAIWGTIAIMCALASMAGYLFFQGVSLGTVSLVMAIAAGAILAMIVDTMIPEAFEKTHDFAGIITVVGFLLAFSLQKIM